METRDAIKSGYFCLIGGGGMMLFGIGGLIIFLNRIQDVKTLSAAQLFRELVLPHIVLLAGFGMLTAAFVLFTRRAVIRRRQAHGEV